MSSRLNPREYDLGELRDAVRGSPRARGDDRFEIARRQRTRYDRPHAGEPEDEHGEGAGQSTGTVPDRRRASQEGEQHEEHRDRTREEPETRRTESRPERESKSRFGPSERGRTDDRSDDAMDRQNGTSRDGHRDDPGPPWGSTDERRAEGRTDGRRTRERAVDARPDRRGGNSSVTETGTTNPLSGPVDAPAYLPRDDVVRPYLAELPDDYGAQLLVFEWLEGLLRTCGHEAAMEALAYYESIGWLSTECHDGLESFVTGLDITGPVDREPLDVDDHRTSLRYVARLADRAGR